MTSLIFIWGFLVGVLAGWVRGFAGFGFSAICVAGLAWFVSPEVIVPVVLILEVLVTLFVWKEALLHLDRAWFKSCVISGLLTIPIGALMLLWLSEEMLKLLVSVLLFVGSLSVRFSLNSKLPDTLLTRLGCGTVMGLFNGVAASGGIVGAIFMSASGLSHTKLRATMVYMLFFSAAYTLICLSVFNIAMGGSGFVWSVQSWIWLALLVVALLLGLKLGRRKFKKTKSNDYRVFVLNLVLFISGIGVVRSIGFYI